MMMEHEPSAPGGWMGRARSGLASAAGATAHAAAGAAGAAAGAVGSGAVSAAGAAYTRARKAVPGTLALTEPLRGTPLERRLATALHTTAHARGPGSQAMSANPLRRGFRIGTRLHQRVRREGYRPSSAGLDVEELVRVHGALLPKIADGTLRPPSSSRPDKTVATAMGSATGELHEIDVDAEDAALGALGWTRLCVDTDEVRARRVLSVVHAYHLDILVSLVGAGPEEYAADMRLLLPHGLPPQVQAALGEASWPVVRLHLLGAGRVAVDDGSGLLVRTFPDCPHKWTGSLLVENGRVTRAELEIRRRPNVAANALNVVSDFVEG